MSEGSAGAHERLCRWADSRGLYVRTIFNEVELLSDRTSPTPLIERWGASKDDAAWYVINVLDRLGVSVPKLSPATLVEDRP